jgi:hypothetical protein
MLVSAAFAVNKGALVASPFFIALLSCRAAVQEPSVVRLVDLFPSAVVAGNVGAPSEISKESSRTSRRAQGNKPKRS